MTERSSTFDAQVENSKSYRGRIPSRLPIHQKRGFQKSKSVNNDETSNFQKDPVQVATVQMNNRPLLRRLRPLSNDSGAKSAMRVKDDVTTVIASKSARVEREKVSATPRKPSTTPKKVPPRFPYNKLVTGKGVITVPLEKNSNDGKPLKFLPKQETIELYEAEIDKGVSDYEYFADEGLLTSCSDVKMQIKVSWQHYLDQYDVMKKDLASRQKNISELLSMMRHYHDKVSAKGGEVDINLPDSKDLSLMNLGLTPQLFEVSPRTKSPLRGSSIDGGVQAIEDLEFDVKKLFNMPSKLVMICEKALSKRKEVIDWFESLLNDAYKQKEKGFGKNMLRMKIYHYNTESHSLRSDLEKNKKDFYSELNDFLNKGIKETLKAAVEESTREIKIELDKINDENEDLRKQLRDRPKNYLPCGHTKQRIEDLEKELNEEKSKEIFLKERAQTAERKSRTSDQLLAKSQNDLKRMHTQTRQLEKTVEQLKTQNQEIQENFDKELTNLTVSIKNNKTYLEEIAKARETLQKEKEDLTDNYNKSLKLMMTEMNEKIQRINDLEEEQRKELAAKQHLETEMDLLNKKLCESEKLNQVINLQLEKKEIQLNETAQLGKEYENKIKVLEKATGEIEGLNKIVADQKYVIKEIEEKAQKHLLFEKTLRSDIATKTEYIVELENKLSLVEETSQENEGKINSYEKQLMELKNKILELQTNLGKFENINDLTEMVAELRNEREEFKDSLKSKELELQQKIKCISEQERAIEESDSLIKMLSEKDNEQANIIKLLRKNLHVKNQAETDFKRELNEKKIEIEKNLKKLDGRKQQITEMEKIIITLEDQARKANLQIRKDQEQIKSLLKKIAYFQSSHIEIKRTIDAPSENLDSILKILEEEMDNSFEQPSKLFNKNMPYGCNLGDANYGDANPNENKYNLESEKGKTNLSSLSSDPETRPTKNSLCNSIKKTVDIKNLMDLNSTGIKGLIPDMNCRKNRPLSPDCTSVKNCSLINSADEFILTNAKLVLPSQLREEKKNKMFKLAGHRL